MNPRRKSKHYSRRMLGLMEQVPAPVPKPVQSRITIVGLCESTGKQIYADLPAAQAAAVRVTQREDRRNQPYQCRECGGWHIGGERWVRAADGKRYRRESR